MKAFGFLLAMLALPVFAQEPPTPVVPKPLDQPPQGSGLRIHAEFTTVSIESNTITYLRSPSNQVVATYPPLKTNDAPLLLFCDKLTGKRTRTGELEMIDADGKVRMAHGIEFALCQHAVYEGTNNQIVLTGPANFPPIVASRPVVGYPCVTFTAPDGRSTNYCITNWADVVIYDNATRKFFFAGNHVTDVPKEFLAATSRTNEARSLDAPGPAAKPAP